MAAKDGDIKKTGVKARVLVDGPFGKINDVITLSEEDAAAAGGAIDTNPKSVAFAESLTK